MELIPTFGGMQVSWENPTGGNIVIMVSEDIMEFGCAAKCGQFYRSKDGSAYIHADMKLCPILSTYKLETAGKQNRC